jgi:two-component system, response regulator PdtaR
MVAPSRYIDEILAPADRNGRRVVHAFKARNPMTSLRILIVEDDALIAMVLEELLATMGHEVCDTTATQIDAVAAAARLKPDLMIVDGALRQGNGVSAVEEITRTGPLPHFFLSGNSGRISAARPDSIVLRKPFRFNELSKAIDSAMSSTDGYDRSWDCH